MIATSMNETIERTENVEQVEARESPLHAEHVRRGATMIEVDGWLVAESYGDMPAEYAAVRGGRGAGLIDLSARGRLEVSGAEAVMFLNGMMTNDIAKLETGAWMSSAFPNVQGRLIAFARVFKLEGQKFLFDTEAATHQALLKALSRFTLAGDFHVRDVTDELACISVQGANANGAVDHVLSVEAASLDKNYVGVFKYQNLTSIVARATHTGEDGFDVFINKDFAALVYERLVDAGVKPIGFAAANALRIEAGIPRFGADISDQNVVLEAAQDEAVSFTKGCYVGQEIIARIHWRGHVAKRLAGVAFETREPVAVGSTLIAASDGKEAGRVTSSIVSPELGRTVAIAMLRYAYLTPDTELTLKDATTPQSARVVELPFVRGGWHEAK